ncbi:MAG: hypothetical protein JWQ49_1880 [Edaphobacter sp.]|nr:hypothetical protein [Edaphobacter sp.]
MLRWVAEKLNLHAPPPVVPPSGTIPPVAQPPSQLPTSGSVDIKSFLAAKQPKNDTQFAAVVAYYYRFEAPEKKDAITTDDLLEACRLAVYKRPPAPGQTLRNAVNAGLLDKKERGSFSINSVGENLVAVTLPSDGASGDTQVRRRRIKKATPKAPAKKTTAKKAATKKDSPNSK